VIQWNPLYATAVYKENYMKSEGIIDNNNNNNNNNVQLPSSLQLEEVFSHPSSAVPQVPDSS
jgi:effector-binding domain-containing protein